MATVLDGNGPLNVLNLPLETCCTDPMTGYYRNGRCDTDEHDRGNHVVCAEMTASFLDFSRRSGNDLSTPRQEFGFPGLKPGDRWCLCASRWLEAEEAGVAPPVHLRRTHRNALRTVDLARLTAHAIDED